MTSIRACLYVYVCRCVTLGDSDSENLSPETDNLIVTLEFNFIVGKKYILMYDCILLKFNWAQFLLLCLSLSIEPFDDWSQQCTREQTTEETDEAK